MPDSLRKLLMQQSVKATAPCRIDAGGTWDIKAMALPFEKIVPTTINAALNLRTSVILCPYDDGWVKVSSEGFPSGETFCRGQLAFKPPFGIFFGAAAYFNVHGLEVKIKSESPVKSALGGSSTALVALIKALSKVTATKRMSGRKILHLAYYLEDAISGGNCGMQDQAAAVYGGVNQWKWQYGDRTTPYQRISLLDREGQKELSKRLLVAYSGESHVSTTTNRKWIKDFLSGRTREGWVKVNQIVHQTARAISRKDWRQAALMLQEEMALRKKLTPEALIPITDKLIEQAERVGCGARFAGAGAGGSLWAIGMIKDIRRLRTLWENTLRPVKEAEILTCEIDPLGVRQS
jgi:D-glycero-alpha-D-manno-heptose-7-phosphate kinase